LADGQEQRAAPAGVQEPRAHAYELVPACCASVPAERIAVELERPAGSAERVLLVAEDARGEEVEEAMLARVRAIRMVQAGGRLEEDAVLATAACERRTLLAARHAGTPAVE